MKILITGGAGFIGSNFIHYWLKNHSGDKIINLDALKYSGNLENLKSIENNSNYEFIHGDICDHELVDKIIGDGTDVVINFAAQTHVDLALHKSYEFIESNIIGVKNLLEASKAHKIKRFHQISTDEVFGDLPLESKEKFNENTQLHPRNEYAATKAAAEHLCSAFFYTYGLPVTISNCTNNIGPYQYPEKFLPLAITNVMDGKKIPVYGSGKYVRDWLYVEDHCSAIDLILEKGRVGERYMIGSSHREITNIDLMKMVLKIMGKGEEYIEHVTDRPGHDVKYAVDSAKMHKLGWQPKYDLEEAVKLTVDWYMNNRGWWDKIKSGEYRKNYEMIYGRKND